MAAIGPDLRQDGVEPGGRSGPTSEFWRYLWFPAVFSVAALLLRQDLVFLLGTLVVGCGAAAYPLCRANVAGVRVRRSGPVHATVGAATEFAYVVENHGRRSAVGLEIEDRPTRLARPAAARFEVPCLGPGRSVTGRATLVFARRGRLALAPPAAASRFPLGVFRTVLPPEEPGEIVVRPREGRATPALLRRLRGRSEQAAKGVSRGRGHDTLYGVREHREGDDPRRIHWRSSARRGQTLVADWRADEGLEVVLVLARAPERGDPRAFERAVSVAATLWRTLHRLGRPGRLVLGVGGTALTTGARGLGAGLDALALVKAGGGRRPHAALRRLSQCERPRSVVVITSGADPRALALARAAAGPGGEAWSLAADGAERSRWVQGIP